jgi:hypothetical protein
MIDPYRTPRRARVEEAYRNAYRRAGFVLTKRGKVLPALPTSTPRTPRFSKLLEPMRTASMTSLPTIRPQVENYSEIPTRLRPAYDLSVLGGYELNQLGAALSAYRCALAKDPYTEPLAPRRKLTRAEWATLLSIAEPNERAYFMRSLVSKRITLKD